jgi:cytochrome c5
MIRRVLALAMPLALVVIAHHEASAQTSPRRDERSGKEVVEAVCAECHAAGVKGAPRIGERAEWSARLSHGLGSAVNAAIRGHGGMPARGGKAELTDNEVRSAIIYMFNPPTAPKEGAAGAAAAGPARPAGNVRTVGRSEIYLGVLPAEVLRSFPKDSVERSMHGGVPSGSGYYHVNVSVLDATTKAPISGAKVEIKVDERGLSSETKALLPIATGSIPSYGNYIRLKGKTPYVFTVKIQRPDSPQPFEAQFEHRVY